MMSGVLLMVLAFALAADYLLPPRMGALIDEDFALVQNELIFRVPDAAFREVNVAQEYDLRAEVVTLELVVPADHKELPPVEAIYIGKGWLDGGTWECTDAALITEDSFDTVALWRDMERPVRLTPWAFASETPDSDVTYDVECERRAGLVEYDRRGFVYVVPTYITVLPMGRKDEDTLEWDVHSKVTVPADWEQILKREQYSWDTSMESTVQGESGRKSSEPSLLPFTHYDGEAMIFVDASRVEVAERAAWISALVGGLGAAIFASGVFGLFERKRYEI